MKRTISVMVGKGSVNHNSRKFHAKNTDPERSHLNVEYCNEDIRDVYHELFEEARIRYNAKQRKDRQVKDYYEKIASGMHPANRKSHFTKSFYRSEIKTIWEQRQRTDSLRRRYWMII